MARKYRKGYLVSKLTRAVLGLANLLFGFVIPMPLMEKSSGIIDGSSFVPVVV